MPELTICIPVAPYHMEHAARAVESVKAQTMECAVLVYQDDERRGAGYARNRLLEAVRSPYVAFLDADDTIEPNFAELCFDILARVQGNRYVYTNWYEGSQVRVAPSPCEVWTQKTYHLVTTVMRTADVRRIGGYDEHMPGAEDTDFGIRLKLSGVCGVHLNAPLLHYRPGGQRSVELRASGKETDMLAYMSQRYGGYTMGCCGSSEPVDNSPQGERRDGDVLAMSMWVGNDRKRGLETGRVYPRTGNGKVCWVDPLDVAAAPQHWKKVSAMPTSTPPVLQPGYAPADAGWQGAAALAFGGSQPAQPQGGEGVDWEYKPVENTRTTSDILKIARNKK
jgi:hypothetical protein